MNVPWEIILAVLGVLVPSVAALWEFVVVGRKRLGWRVQMDTTATDTVRSQHAGALKQIQHEAGRPLKDPSFVLLRIENAGATNIDWNDYSVPEGQKVGPHVVFPGRRVAGMVVVELSDEYLRDSFDEDSGLALRDGEIHLPRVPLNRGTHYKVLAALERDPGDPGPAPDKFPKPRVIAGIKGGTVKETEASVGVTARTMLLIGFLVAVIAGQFAVSVVREDEGRGDPIDCAEGSLTLVGSSAFAPVLREAVSLYTEECTGADIAIETSSSREGLDRAREDTSNSVIAFHDGRKSDRYTDLTGSPVALSLFTLIAHPDLGVEDLSLEQIREIYDIDGADPGAGLPDGEVAAWSDGNLGGEGSIILVVRETDSGTRGAFIDRVLDQEPGAYAEQIDPDCAPSDAGRPTRCQEGGTGDVLRQVAGTPGALGYAAVGDATEAAARGEVNLVAIGGRSATLENAEGGVYPLWETEYAYTHGEPPADSLAASFLRYLTHQVGRDIIRAEGHRPCTELRNPVQCRPERGAESAEETAEEEGTAASGPER